MLSTRNIPLAMAMLATTEMAVAGQPPALVVLVQYVVSGSSPGHVEETLTSPLERTLVTLPRAVNMVSVTSDSAGGVTVDLEMQFDGGATSQDVVAVLGRMAQLDIGKDVGPTAVSVHLGPTRIDSNTGLPLR
ncbi:hypothetical protein [Pseudoduganella albidiflava]|uniref:GerMN domain-containing protein n=1 Tax=Pseudoduganella albidiflava TaxID=321983 RepID=A0A411WZC7_9BURK|nr:hypothetical protein [Pseudoduganella albidiflava]QBI02051.1 hypothetical protein EYF70_15200 [Pseudoduganella albidiflava]GGY65154.1 hypothetical protein GCM10007387_54340 [Pseudoduganella albidiflava]